MFQQAIGVIPMNVWEVWEFEISKLNAVLNYCDQLKVKKEYQLLVPPTPHLPNSYGAQLKTH